ncbi:MAG: hypothetical protein JWR42_750 [Marmoricola sp.]|nr:hypothetical protein [Marmoricola sp.]
MEIVLSVLALVVALVALGVALASRRSRHAVPDESSLAELPEDAHALRREVAALKAESAQTMRHVAVVRYDAFTDTGGQLSWSVALLDDHGSGVVLSSIQGRNESRSYAKSIDAWSSETQLSPEEEDAISHARP